MMMDICGLFLHLSYVCRIKLSYVYLGLNVTVLWIIQYNKVFVLHFPKGVGRLLPQVELVFGASLMIKSTEVLFF